jgi:DNA-directed RNA polymerase specialized sigma24 family protein
MAAAADAAGRAALIESVQPVVRAILVQKSGMTLAADDDRHDNFETIELYHGVILRLLERLDAGASEAEVRDFKGYAARVAYNAWSDYLRAKYPERTSLKNSMRYFFEHQPKYAVWESASGDTLCGLKAWQLGRERAPAERVAMLKDGRAKLPAGVVPPADRKRAANRRYSNVEWDQLLGGMLASAGGPVEIDDAVGIVAGAIGLVETARPVYDGAGDATDSEEEATSPESPDESALTPEEMAQLRELLALIWRLVGGLQMGYRRPFVLNPPAVQGERLDLALFVEHGTIRIVDIGRLLALTLSDYGVLWTHVDLPAADRVEAASLSELDEHAAMLFKQLPIADRSIGALMGVPAQTVINRRNQGRVVLERELVRALSSAPMSATRSRL